MRFPSFQLAGPAAMQNEQQRHVGSLTTQHTGSILQGAKELGFSGLRDDDVRVFNVARLTTKHSGSNEGRNCTGAWTRLLKALGNQMVLEHLGFHSNAVEATVPRHVKTCRIQAFPPLESYKLEPSP